MSDHMDDVPTVWDQLRELRAENAFLREESETLSILCRDEAERATIAERERDALIRMCYRLWDEETGEVIIEMPTLPYSSTMPEAEAREMIRAEAGLPPKEGEPDV